MKKKLLIEQTQAYYGQSKVDEIIDPIIRDAIDSGCLNEYMKSITSYDVKHPITGKNTVQVSTSEDVFVQSDNRSYPLFAYITSTPYGQEGQYKIDYFYKKGGINYYEKTKGWKCQTSGIKKKISDALEKTGRFKSQEKKPEDLTNYKLVNVLDDSKTDIALYNTVDSWDSYSKILSNIKTPLMMWKVVATKSVALDIKSRRDEIENYFSGKDYKRCTIEKSDEGIYATINLHKMYPETFEKDFTICKEWSLIGTSKPDCIAAFDGYINKVKTYNNAPQNVPNLRELEIEKDVVNRCLGVWGDKMPFKQKKMDFIRELKPSHPFYIRESEDELTNVIRESLRIIKKRKNR
jgi:hypothetical protein